MKKLLELLRQPGFSIFLFCLMSLLVNWPFLVIAGEAGLKSIFVYLYAVWSLLIVLLFLIQKSLRAQDKGPRQRGGG